MVLEPGVRVLVAVTLVPRATHHPLFSPQLLPKVQALCSRRAQITKGKIPLCRTEYFVNVIMC